MFLFWIFFIPNQICAKCFEMSNAIPCMKSIATSFITSKLSNSKRLDNPLTPFILFYFIFTCIFIDEIRSCNGFGVRSQFHIILPKISYRFCSFNIFNGAACMVTNRTGYFPTGPTIFCTIALADKSQLDRHQQHKVSEFIASCRCILSRGTVPDRTFSDRILLDRLIAAATFFRNIGLILILPGRFFEHDCLFFY